MRTVTGRRVPPADRFDRALLPPMLLGAILNPINSSVIAVALVPIGTALGAPASQAAWLVSALYVATAIGQPLVGRLVDSYGARRMFLIAAVLTVAAGLIGTFAANIWVLVVARVLLGFGTCAGYPAAMSLIRSEADRTGVASPAGVLSLLTISTQTIAVIGPTLGGLLVAVGGWRATIGINIVLGAANLVLGWLYLPRPISTDQSSREAASRVDLVGIGLFAATLVTVLLFLMTPRVALLWLPALAVLVGWAFARWELRHPNPFIDVRVFAGNVPLLASYLRAFLASIVSYAFLYGVSQWLEQGRGLSASVTGLVLVPIFVVGIAVTAVTGRRSEIRAKLIVGALGQIVACALLLLLGADSAVWLLLLVTSVLGVPQGLVSLANQNAVYYQARPDRIGASAGLLRTFMYLGAMVASSASGFFFGQQATTDGLHELGWFTLVTAVVFLAVTLVDRALVQVGRAQPQARAKES